VPINGPLGISLEHPLLTQSTDREAVTILQPRSVTAFCRRCQHETIEENTLVGVARGLIVLGLLWLHFAANSMLERT